MRITAKGPLWLDPRVAPFERVTATGEFRCIVLRLRISFARNEVLPNVVAIRPSCFRVRQRSDRGGLISVLELDEHPARVFSVQSEADRELGDEIRRFPFALRATSAENANVLAIAFLCPAAYLDDLRKCDDAALEIVVEFPHNIEIPLRVALRRVPGSSTVKVEGVSRCSNPVRLRVHLAILTLLLVFTYALALRAENVYRPLISPALFQQVLALSVGGLLALPLLRLALQVRTAQGIGGLWRYPEIYLDGDVADALSRRRATPVVALVLLASLMLAGWQWAVPPGEPIDGVLYDPVVKQLVDEGARIPWRRLPHLIVLAGDDTTRAVGSLKRTRLAYHPEYRHFRIHVRGDGPGVRECLGQSYARGRDTIIVSGRSRIVGLCDELTAAMFNPEYRSQPNAGVPRIWNDNGVVVISAPDQMNQTEWQAYWTQWTRAVKQESVDSLLSGQVVGRYLELPPQLGIDSATFESEAQRQVALYTHADYMDTAVQALASLSLLFQLRSRVARPSYADFERFVNPLTEALNGPERGPIIDRRDEQRMLLRLLLTLEKRSPDLDEHVNSAIQAAFTRAGQEGYFMLLEEMLKERLLDDVGGSAAARAARRQFIVARLAELSPTDSLPKQISILRKQYPESDGLRELEARLVS